MLSARKLYWPAINIVGPGALKEAGAEIAKMGLKKALIVTDAVLNKLGVVKNVEDALNEHHIQFHVYDNVQPNPTMKNCHDGLDAFNANACDFLISVGGSPQDCAKAIGILKTNGGKISAYEGVFKSKNKSVPIIAINTTAGTASEVTINYIISRMPGLASCIRWRINSVRNIICRMAWRTRFFCPMSKNLTWKRALKRRKNWRKSSEFLPKICPQARSKRLSLII